MERQKWLGAGCRPSVGLSHRSPGTGWFPRLALNWVRIARSFYSHLNETLDMWWPGQTMTLGELALATEACNNSSYSNISFPKPVGLGGHFYFSSIPVLCFIEDIHSYPIRHIPDVWMTWWFVALIKRYCWTLFILDRHTARLPAHNVNITYFFIMHFFSKLAEMETHSRWEAVSATNGVSGWREWQVLRQMEGTQVSSDVSMFGRRDKHFLTSP